MDEDQLARELNEDLEQARRITEIVEPLLGWRDALIRRANARAELLRPAAPQSAIEDALRAARNMIAHEFVPGATGTASAPSVVDELGPHPPLLVSRPAGPEARAQFVAGPPLESLFEVGTVMEDVLQSAGRPLHRDELYQRSTLHEFGPVNRSTLITRLSRDARFEKLRSQPGYWMLAAWPPEKKRGQIVTAGRVYAETITKMERDFRTLVAMANDLNHYTSRLHQLRAYRSRDPERAAVFDSEIPITEQLTRRLTVEIRRHLRLIESERERAIAFRHELGAEAERYPAIPAMPNLNQVGELERPEPTPPYEDGDDDGGEP